MEHTKYDKVVNLFDYRKNNKEIDYNKKTLFILIGIPCSGKTYYARNNFDDHDTIIVSTDELRKEINGTYLFYENQNKTIHAEARKRVKKYLSLGYNVVYDATNTNKVFRKDFISIAKKLNCDVIGVVFQTQIEICLDRNKQRPYERRVPEDKILLMSNFNHEIDESEGFNSIKYI